MRRTLIVGALVMVAGLAGATPKGKNLGEAEKWLESEKLINQSQKSASDACGVKLAITYDDKSFGTTSLDDAKPAPVYCRDAFNALWGSVCRSPEGKAAVQAKVNAFSCQLSTDGTRVTLDGKTLTIHVDPKKKDIGGFVPGGEAWAREIKKVL